MKEDKREMRQDGLEIEKKDENKQIMQNEEILNKDSVRKKYGQKHLTKKIIVNLITLIRSLGSIAIVPIYCVGGSLMAGMSALGFFATDFLDGFLARKWRVQSFFGCLLDALSDKAFGVVCLMILATQNPIFLAIIGLELGIFAINYKSVDKGNNVQSSMVGKVKTCLLAGTIVGSFFAQAAPTLKQLLNYINVASFNTLLELNPTLLTTILAIPTIGASLYVANDYRKKAQGQSQNKELEQKDIEIKTLQESANNQTELELSKNLTLKEIKIQKEELKRQKSILQTMLDQKWKSKSEILFALFDTDFYLEHKDDDIKKLIYK